MISWINKNDQLNEIKNSLNVTYSRTINIIFGNYPYPEKIHNFILEIKNNLDSRMQNFTNVKGGMTDWNFFNERESFKNFIAYVINTHQKTHPHIFEYFYEKYMVKSSWGTEIKKGDSLDFHDHFHFHGILYLTKGCDLILPELNIKITPEPGNYYIFPPFISHGFKKSVEELNRYSLVFNIEQGEVFNFEKKIKEINERKNS